MTIFGWDASHHDWSRGPMDIGAAVRDGIQFMTHKIGEARTVTDDRYDDFYRRAKGVVPLLGAYYVNHPGDQNYQADRMLWLLDDKAPGWRDGPFILQVDAEKFDYMDRAPNKAECKAFCDRLVSKTGGRFRPLLYAPKWLYGNTLDGVGYPLWASSYGTNPVVGYRSAYPGDGSTRWAAYSGQTPVILQYGSRTKIGSQSTCDANAYRGTLAQLRALVYRAAQTEEDELDTAQNAALSDAWSVSVAQRTGGSAPASTTRPAGPIWEVEQLKSIGSAQTQILANLQQLAGRDFVDEQAIVDGVLAGLGTKDPATIAAALLAVLTPEQAQAVGQLLTAG